MSEENLDSEALGFEMIALYAGMDHYTQQAIESYVESRKKGDNTPRTIAAAAHALIVADAFDRVIRVRYPNDNAFYGKMTRERLEQINLFLDRDIANKS